MEYRGEEVICRGAPSGVCENMLESGDTTSNLIHSIFAQPSSRQSYAYNPILCIALMIRGPTAMRIGLVMCPVQVEPKMVYCAVVVSRQATATFP